jgi:hypothetical protein
MSGQCTRHHPLPQFTATSFTHMHTDGSSFVHRKIYLDHDCSKLQVSLPFQDGSKLSTHSLRVQQCAQPSQSQWTSPARHKSSLCWVIFLSKRALKAWGKKIILGRGVWWEGCVLLKKWMLAVESVDKKYHKTVEMLWILCYASLHLQHKHYHLLIPTSHKCWLDCQVMHKDARSFPFLTRLLKGQDCCHALRAKGWHKQCLYKSNTITAYIYQMPEEFC